MRSTFNIHDLECGMQFLGPGKRCIIWLQGCFLNCKGCLNPHLQPFIEKRLLTPKGLFKKLSKKMKDEEGITITGGEPFLQPKPLSKFVKIVKGETSLSIIVYSGFYLKELLSSMNEYVYEVLENIDVLIDGRFKEDELVQGGYIGSGNQTIYFFSDVYSEKDFRREKNLVEIKAMEDKFKITGFYK